MATTNYKWVEWKNRKHGTIVAYAVDPDSKNRTGTLRAINGSSIPDTARPARPSTPRDPFCLKIIESRESGVPSRKRGKGQLREGLNWEKGSVIVVIGGQKVRTFSPAEVRDKGLRKGDAELNVGEKMWTINQGGKRRASGKVGASADSGDAVAVH